MIGTSGTMTPVSTDGSEWSGINQYQFLNGKSEPASPNPAPRAALATPPSSGGPPFGPLELNAPDSNGNGPRPPGPPHNPSPPNSVTSRSRISDGTLSDQSSQRYRRMEEVLSQHYVVLKRFLTQSLRDEAGNLRSNRARDKLLRLSAVQFIELSTDVYDELLRRQATAAASRPGPPRQEIPPYLLPRPEFHEKRNHARQKLASLQHQRFKDLATDVYCELERRFPHFQNPDRRGSATPSVRGGRYPSGSSGYGPRPDSNGQYGYPPNGYPPRAQSRGPPGPGGRGYPPGPPGGRFPPRQGSLGGLPPPPGSPAGLGINGDTIPENAPYQKSFQANTIVPNKGTLIEDDEDGSMFDDDDRRSDAFALDRVLQGRRDTSTTMGGSDRDKKLADAQSQVSTLEAKVEQLESESKKKDEEIDSMRSDNETTSNTMHADKLEWEEVKSDLTSKLTSAQELNTSLHNELDNVRRQQESMELEFQQHMEEISQNNGSDGGEWKTRFEELDGKHNALQLELQSQHDVTEQVRQEASNFLLEMKALSEQGGVSWEREESLVRENHRLEEEMKHWKGRYERSKTQLRHLRSSSFGLPGYNPDTEMLAKQHELMHHDGLIKDISVTKFQTSIDELLRSARSGGPDLVLEQMKSVVIAVRHMSQDVESQAYTKEDALRLPTRAKTRVSSTANNLITASKNFANSNGLSPVSLLDAAASHLTAAVIELLRHAKIRPTSEDELAQADEEDYTASMQSPGYFSVAPSQSRVSANESVYSAISSPPSMRSMAQTNPRLAAARSTLQNGYSIPEGDKALEDLRLYLEGQTEGLVESIQALVSSIRAEDDLSSVRTHIDTISDVVGKVISSAGAAMGQPDANVALRERVGPIVQLLENCRYDLVGTGAEGENLTNAAEMRELTGKLPPIAFQIARETKELVQRVDQLENESREDDDFC